VRVSLLVSHCHDQKTSILTACVRSEKFCCPRTSPLKQASDLYPQQWTVAELFPSRTEDTILLPQSLSTWSGALVTVFGYNSAQTSNYRAELNWMRFGFADKPELHHAGLRNTEPAVGQQWVRSSCEYGISFTQTRPADAGNPTCRYTDWADWLIAWPCGGQAAGPANSYR